MKSGFDSWRPFPTAATVSALRSKVVGSPNRALLRSPIRVALAKSLAQNPVGSASQIECTMIQGQICATSIPAQRSGGESALLCAIYEELQGLRACLSEVQARICDALPVQSRRAVSISAAQSILGCGRSRVYELLRSGALRRAPKVGRQVMISSTSLEALLDNVYRDPTPKLKRRASQGDAKRGEKEAEAILRMIRPGWPKHAGSALAER
jgi:hypothetical protein